MDFQSEKKGEIVENDVVVDCESDEEVFFGVPTARELKLRRRLANRRTEIYRPGFRLDSSVLTNDDSSSLESVSSPRFVSRCEIQVESYEEIREKLEKLKLNSDSDENESNKIDLDDKTNDSLEIHRRKSQNSVHLGLSRASEVEQNDEDSLDGDETSISYDDSLNSKVCNEDFDVSQSVEDRNRSENGKSLDSCPNPNDLITKTDESQVESVGNVVPPSSPSSLFENSCDYDESLNDSRWFNSSKVGFVSSCMFEDSLEAKIESVVKETYEDRKRTSVRSFDSDIVDDSITSTGKYESEIEDLEDFVSASESLKRDSVELNDRKKFFKNETDDREKVVSAFETSMPSIEKGTLNRDSVEFEVFSTANDCQNLECNETSDVESVVPVFEAQSPVSEPNETESLERDSFEFNETETTNKDLNEVGDLELSVLMSEASNRTPAACECESLKLESVQFEDFEATNNGQNKDQVETEDLESVIPASEAQSPISELLSMIEAADKDKYLNLSDFHQDLSTSIVKHCEPNKSYIEIEDIENVIPLSKPSSPTSEEIKEARTLNLSDLHPVLAEQLTEPELSNRCTKEESIETEELPTSEQSSPAAFEAERFRSLRLSDLQHDLEAVFENSDHRRVEAEATNSEEFRLDAKASEVLSPKSLRLSDMNHGSDVVLTTESSDIELGTFDEKIGRDFACQTSFVVSESPIVTPIPKVKAKRPLQTTPEMRFPKSQQPKTPSQLPIPVKSKPTITITNHSAKNSEKFKLPEPKRNTSKKLGSSSLSKSKFDHIRSPIAAYIRDDPPPTAIQNVKPHQKSRLRMNLQSKLLVQAATVENNEELSSSSSTVDSEDKNNENVPPVACSLPFVTNVLKPMAVCQKNWEKVTKIHTIKNKKLPVSTTKVPLVMRHGGQHKKLHWAEKLVSDKLPLSSPNHPIGIAPPILLKSFDMNVSVVDGPNVVDVSIVSVVNDRYNQTKK